MTFAHTTSSGVPDGGLATRFAASVGGRQPHGGDIVFASLPVTACAVRAWYLGCVEKSIDEFAIDGASYN